MRRLALIATLTALGGGLAWMQAPPATAMCGGFVRPQQAVLTKGDQRVFIFHRNGMQHLVLENSFKGNAKDFGMVLPLPAAPEIKKVDRKFFGQLITLTHKNWRMGKGAARQSEDASKPSSTGGAPPVVVLNRAIVGVFEAVTLGAATSRSLTDWMDKHGYTYDKTATDLFADYVKRGWVFVVIRTKLGAGVTRFDGALQPMGFRFPTKQPVLPVRMAAVNPTGMMFDMYFVAEHGVTLPDFPANFCKHRAKVLSSPAIRATLAANTALGRELARDTVLSDAKPDRGLGGADGLGTTDADRIAAMRQRLSSLHITRFRGFFPRKTMLRRDLVIEKHDASVAAVRQAIATAVATGSYGADKLAAAVQSDASYTALVGNVAHTDYRVRRLVAEALGKIGRKKAATGVLMGRLKVEKDDFVKSGIVKSLRALTGQKFATYDVKKWVRWWEGQQK